LSDQLLSRDARAKVGRGNEEISSGEGKTCCYFRCIEEMKKLAAEKAVDKYAKSGMCVDFGAGSTVAFAVSHLARLFKEEKISNIQVVCNSVQTESQARSLGLPVVALDTVDIVNVAFDGADEVDAELNLIKGRGYCALVRDRIAESAARTFVIICDESKLVTQLASKGALPVEVVPFGWTQTSKRLQEQCGCSAALVRDKATEEPVITDNGNYVLHCTFEHPLEISTIQQHHIPRLQACPGVVDHGFFLGMAHAVVVAEASGRVCEMRKKFDSAMKLRVHRSFL